MKNVGFALLAIGAALMIWGFFQPSNDRPSRDEAYWEMVRAKMDERGGESQNLSSIQDGTFSPQRAQNRQLIFGGGAAMLLLGGIFTAAGYRTRKD